MISRIQLLAGAALGLSTGFTAMAATPPAPSAKAAVPAAASGLLPVKIISAEGRIMMTLPPPDKDGVAGRFLYATALRTGLGSASLGLERARMGPTYILAFRRLGKKVAVTFENPRFRATDGSPTEQASARNSFPFTTIWMGDIASTEADGSIVVDIAPFLTRDVLNIAGDLNKGGKGFKLVDMLSAADPASVKIFPDNIEMEAIQTFQSDAPGDEIDEIAPDGRQVSFVVHHSLVRLPEPGYQPLRFDVRAGGFATQVFDFSTPLGQDVVYQLANRFRLEKVDPSAARSRVKKPIVYYIDSAAPEPIRQALADGVAWWSDAFDAAGLIDAFQVKILPPDVDPLDIRYNVVNWGNRLTRGWSFGQVIADPRTGEIVKSSVFLGSLRVRQDMIIFESLVGAKETNSGSPNDPIKASLARIRQLGAHEVGHAIGFVHNFAASTQGRLSVMDYPGPLIGVKEGKIDLSDAYAAGIGTWDKFTVDWLYGQPAPGVDPTAAAAAKASAAQKAGLRFTTDIDGRAPDSPTPWGSMWDNGPDPAAELVRMMDVRKVAIANFGPGVLRPDEPLANLRRKFVPVWLLHRYQVDAAAKLLGGVDYAYQLAGDGTAPPAPVPATLQNAALDALLGTLSINALSVPDSLVAPLSSGIQGRRDPQFDIEVFANAGASVFDPLAATDVAAQVALDALLAPSRLTRIYGQHARDPKLPGIETLLDRLLATTVDSHGSAVGQRIAFRTLISIARAANGRTTSPEVSAILSDRLESIAGRLAKGTGATAAWDHNMARLLRNSDALKAETGKASHAPAIPPGMPIGAETEWMDDLM